MQEATVNPTWRIRGVCGRRSHSHVLLTLTGIASAAVLGRGPVSRMRHGIPGTGTPAHPATLAGARQTQAARAPGLLAGRAGLTGLIAGLLRCRSVSGIAATFFVYVRYERCLGFSMDLLSADRGARDRPAVGASPSAGSVSRSGPELDGSGVERKGPGPDQIGWDWYAFQLSSGQELMFYRLRRRDGSTDPHSAGTIVLCDGTPVARAAGEVLIDTLSTWVSPRGGYHYPARTRLRVPKADLELEVTPWLPDQELEVSVRYWEGAVEARGTARGLPVTGRGYLELTGYADG